MPHFLLIFHCQSKAENMIPIQMRANCRNLLCIHDMIRVMNRCLFYIIMIIVLPSCQTTMVDYPIFGETNEYEADALRKKINVVDVYEFKNSFEEEIQKLFFHISDSSRFDDYLFKLSEKNDSILIAINNAPLPFILSSAPQKSLGMIVHKNPKGNKRLFFVHNGKVPFFAKRTKNKYSFCPKRIKLPKDMVVVYYDMTTTFKGYLLDDSLHVNLFIIDNKIIENCTDIFSTK